MWRRASASPSLRLRLGVWYGALTGVVILLVTLLTYTLHTRYHYDDADAVLIGVAQHLATELKGPAVAQQVSLASPTAGVALRVYSSDGRLLGASPEADVSPIVTPADALAHPGGPPFDPLVGLAPSFQVVDPGSGVLGTIGDSHGMRWRVYTLPLQDGRTLVAELSLDRVDAAVDRLREVVPVLAVLGATTTVLAGFLLAGRALRPVATLTGAALSIAGSRDFERRVPEPPRHDELGRLARTFNAMLTSLQQAYQAQKQFVADASHELRAPLTAIQGNLELLERHPEMDEADRQEALGDANREARRLTQLVADLLSLARADAGVAIRRERVELDRVVLGVIGEARQLTRGQRVNIDAIEPVEVLGDPDRLRELTLILLDNAIKYTPPAGAISVSLHREDRAVLLEIHDTGIGISDQDLPHVFERFFRADPARRRDAGGTGLGLSIARWIGDQHHAQIRLTSTPGRGTRALVRFAVST